MWERIKRWLNGGRNDAPSQLVQSEYDFKWYDAGEDNPFGIRILDIRSLTWSVIATTESPQIAELFNKQRSTVGREFISAEIEESRRIQCNFTIPHDGTALEGIVFKADSMDIKWDIYIYDATFLFVRSWTGQLQYRASAVISQDRITIHEVEASESTIEFAPQLVKFLLVSHAMRRAIPHMIPKDTPDNPKLIAIMSFSMFGKLACYATYEDILNLEIRIETPKV